MTYKIKRYDGQTDHLTSCEFISYLEAYDLIEKEIGSQCCSDTDFEKEIYYHIIKI